MLKGPLARLEFGRREPPRALVDSHPCYLPWAVEELCTLVITEAFPEDSGLFKCMAVNPFGSVACSALLEVYNGKERLPIYSILRVCPY